MTQHDMDRAALARIQDPAQVRLRAAFDFAHAAVAAMRTLGRTARGALVLSYISPCLLRTPDKGRACPEGWREVGLANQGHTALNGVWWVCDEAFRTIEARFADGGVS